MVAPSLPPEDYTVGWICALPTELTAATAMLEKKHGPLKHLPKHDENTYTLGSIGPHNIVLLCLPVYGTSAAAVAAKSMQSTFPNLRFGLMVGVGGGVPSPANDIRLGDIAISMPSGQNGGVVQYDVGKAEEGGFRRTGFQNSPPTILMTAVRHLAADRDLDEKITQVVNEAFPRPKDAGWRYPSPVNDVLFEVRGDVAGESEVSRPSRHTQDPVCFYGSIGSGNSVIKNGRVRQLLAEKEGLICFEMEAGGLMNFFKCIVIRGICDYSDEHKHKEWQPYAATVAAAYAKILLSVISPEAVSKMPPVRSE